VFYKLWNIGLFLVFNKVLNFPRFMENEVLLIAM